MKVLLHSKAFNTSIVKQVEGLIHKLREAGTQIAASPSFQSFFNKKSPNHQWIDIPMNEVDMVICLGGDGTMLDAARIVKDSGIPIMGINTGRLGFLANVAVEDIELAVSYLLNNDFSLDPRTLIGVECSSIKLGDFNFALNEVTVHKKETSSMISVHTNINEEFMNTYWADGLIVSTPTGSTAYSLSCGGPIVMPGSKNIILTPIAPHNLNVRPVVIPDSNIINIKPEGRDRHMLLTIDSRSHTIPSGEEITLRLAPFTINLIKLPNQDFFSTIRHKMMWGIDRRN